MPTGTSKLVPGDDPIWQNASWLPNVEVLAPSNNYVPSSRGLYLLEKDVWTEEMSGQDRQDTRYECNTKKFDERGAA